MKRSEAFLPFRIDLKPGAPLSEQVVYAVEKAIISGLLRPGDRFPSIRALSQDLRIHPNTTQKAVSSLIDQGYLEALPGIGTSVARTLPVASRRTEAIKAEAERLVLQAKRMRLNLADLQHILESQWNKLTND
jgi:DNA-binding transcriptional regulator YhcF (GntR family)